LAGSLLLSACASHSPAGRPAAAAPQLVAPAPPAAGDIVIAAMALLDRPYRAGGASAETGFDCSAFTRHVYGQALGIELPRSAQEQAAAPMLRPVAGDVALQAGDLVFFNTQQRTYSHVGIYLGDGRFVHAPRTGAQIRTESISAAYWSRRYTGARRAAVIEANP